MRTLQEKVYDDIHPQETQRKQSKLFKVLTVGPSTQHSRGSVCGLL
jgi:hypothetical protein